MVTAKMIKKLARGYGADLVGIGEMSRYEGAPPQMDPRFIRPGCCGLGTDGASCRSLRRRRPVRDQQVAAVLAIAQT